MKIKSSEREPIKPLTKLNITPTIYRTTNPLSTDKPQLPPRRASANIMYGYVRGIVNVTCEAEAEPPATFTWYRDDKKLSPKQHFIHTQGHESILQVK